MRVRLQQVPDVHEMSTGFLGALPTGLGFGENHSEGGEKMRITSVSDCLLRSGKLCYYAINGANVREERQERQMAFSRHDGIAGLLRARDGSLELLEAVFEVTSFEPNRSQRETGPCLYEFGNASLYAGQRDVFRRP